jgi:hypothetical protein
MDRVTSRADIQRWRRNFRDEVDGATIYRAMADGEPNAELAQVYRRSWVRYHCMKASRLRWPTRRWR